MRSTKTLRHEYAYYTALELRKARIERQWSRETLADISGVHVNTINSWENSCHDTNFAVKCKVLTALGCKSICMTNETEHIILSSSDTPFPRSDLTAVPLSSIVYIIGKAMREKRLFMELSLAELSARSGIHRNTLWNMERGLVCFNSFTLFRVYRALGISTVTPAWYSLELA